MFAHAKGVLIVVCVLLCMLMAMGGRSDAPVAARAKQAQGPEAAAGAETMLVEAFVVEVNLPALAELGVSPVGEEPHTASVADILKCLDNGQARVVAGAKAASGQGEAAVQVRKTTYVKRETGNPPVTAISPYDSGETFSIFAAGVSDGASRARVRVEFKLSLSLSTETARDPGVPPDRATWEWSGSVALEPGKPAIAAATQNDKTVAFLLLTAHVAGK